MKVTKFICKNCGYKFEEKIFEPGEAKERNLRTSPVVCNRCGSTNVERR